MMKADSQGENWQGEGPLHAARPRPQETDNVVFLQDPDWPPLTYADLPRMKYRFDTLEHIIQSVSSLAGPVLLVLTCAAIGWALTRS
ncbi:hypothetical protein [Sphingobium sp. TKS]|uniref:hypothetical protein n=1 Tax=Sphingobium sp. TKS TaxID=1315974 RepID=UPI0007703A3B|nr:hypothetical protein [Sphingobium sp. TKS]AMK26102.1 hypothetical protein K426_26015 [Sphingobium sp. TKS]